MTMLRNTVSLSCPHTRSHSQKEFGAKEGCLGVVCSGEETESHRDSITRPQLLNERPSISLKRRKCLDIITVPSDVVAEG